MIIFIILLQFQQPKAIRTGGYQQEIYFGNSPPPQQVQQVQQYVNRPQILPQKTLQGSVNPHAVPLIKTKGVIPTPPPAIIRQTTTTETPDEEDEEENIPLAALRNRGIIITTEGPRSTTESLTSEEEEDQAKSAHYNFNTSVRDTINDHEHVRSEVRDGLKLTGMYSYSDGFFKRTVHYQADENGYRVTNEEVTPIVGEGPKFNPKGTADVKNTLAGDYSITVGDFRLNKQQEQIIKDSNV